MSLKRKHGVLEKDNADLQELLYSLRCRSESEAIAILRDLRSKRDPSSVLQHVKDSDVLLQASRDLLSDKNNKYKDKINVGSLDFHAPERSNFGVASANESNLALSNRESANNSYHTNDSPTQSDSSVIGAVERNLALSNPGPADTSHPTKDRSNDMISLVRERTSHSLQKSVEMLEELYHHLQVMPEIQLLSVLQRIRSGGDALSVLHFVQHGDHQVQQALATSSGKESCERLKLLDAANPSRELHPKA